MNVMDLACKIFPRSALRNAPRYRRACCGCAWRLKRERVWTTATQYCSIRSTIRALIAKRSRATSRRTAAGPQCRSRKDCKHKVHNVITALKTGARHPPPTHQPLRTTPLQNQSASRGSLTCIECCRRKRAIHTSFARNGLPALFSSCRIAGVARVARSPDRC